MESPSLEIDPLEPLEDGLRIRSLSRVLLDWRGARDRVRRYLQALRLEEGEIDRSTLRILSRALGRESDESAVCDAMDEGVHLLMEEHPLAGGAPTESIDDLFLRWRLALWQQRKPLPGPLPEPEMFAATPPLTRSSMAPEHFRGRRLGGSRSVTEPSSIDRTTSPEREIRRRARRSWNRSGHVRRAILTALVVVPSVAAGLAFLGTLPARVWLPAEITMAAFFGLLFGWISIGFWTAVFGFFVQLRGGDGFAIARNTLETREEPDPGESACRTALVVPVCDESVPHVFARLRAMRASLTETGMGEAFHFFILSDSVDPDIASDELSAWAAWRRDALPGGGIYYRRRRVRPKRKSGNVADFCRRFGRQYRYMVVLDADSVMGGEALVRLVRLMETHPHVGIIQTAPRIIRARSLYARLQQFSNQLYGPMFAAGLHYWQLGDCPYWGHNAIIRVEPFMKHGALPRLEGKPPFGGEILSHDFVEAALLGRAGWSVWLDFEPTGSYEETPESLLEEMKRDRRWCQGNLQHLRLLFTEGLAPMHRALFLNGIFSYVSAALWLGFLVASTVEAALWALVGPDYFAAGRSLFPTWPVWRPERVGALLAVVLTVLFLPKLLALLLVLRADGGAAFGGAARLLRSVLAECVASALLAPVRMAFYSRFVLKNLLGRVVGWGGGADEQGETTWGHAVRFHGLDVFTACLWAGGVYWLEPAAFWWLTPVAGALVGSLPLSVWSSRASLGIRARLAGWLLTPDELSPPPVVAHVEAELESGIDSGHDGFRAVVVDPFCNAIHSVHARGPRTVSPGVRAARSALVERAVTGGPSALDADEKRILLTDAASLCEIHRRVWRLEEKTRAARWGIGDERVEHDGTPEERSRVRLPEISSRPS